MISCELQSGQTIVGFQSGHCRDHIVKLARAKLSAMAAGILFRRQKSPQVIYMEPLLLVSVRFFSILGTFPFNQYQAFYPKEPFVAFEVNDKLSKFGSILKIWIVHYWLFNPLSKKTQFNEKIFTIVRMIGNWQKSLLISLTSLQWKNIMEQK